MAKACNHIAPHRAIVMLRQVYTDTAYWLIGRQTIDNSCKHALE